MRLLPLAAIMSFALLTACTAQDKPKDAAAAPAADSAAPATPAATKPEPAVGPDGPPSAKIAADQVGKVSPVPAFKGFGKHWTIDVQAAGEMNHKVELSWNGGAEKASGTARYYGHPDDVRSALIVLSGEVSIGNGAKPVKIEIIRRECSDDAGNKHEQSVKVHVEGMDTLSGCGDLAVY